MDKPSTFIYTGLFIIVLGLGDDKGRLIPNEYVWILGGLGLIYGIFLQLKLEGKIFPANAEWKFDLRKLPSKAYIIIGVGFISQFPLLMDYKLLGIGLAFFIMGWTVQKFGLS